MTDWVIRAEGLGRKFGEVHAVQGLDLAVERASIYGFLGPNGSGKTTAIRMLTGLLRPSAGSVSVLGHSLPDEAETLRLKIGYMTQRFSLYDDLTVLENLAFVASVYGLRGADRRQRIAQLLETYQLQSVAQQLAGGMSGGQRQRLSLAAATLHRPELLFLDEPTSAVDPENRREFWEQLFDLCDQGATILVSTHYMDEAERCHRLAILESGHKCADGTPDALMREMGVQVVEIAAANPRRLKQALLTVDGVVSAAQLGSRLRVLVDAHIDDPLGFLRQQPAVAANDQLERVRPSLEDVFVTSTGQGDPG
ncbi:MAG: ABC transporter ATP-binding protein [Gammaproteobacteria bacterium]|nr:ABC transporter ATP-binding protein [Gammaproteobacteria bacterium]